MLHTYVMHRASLVLSLGADFRLMGGAHHAAEQQTCRSRGAVRTGCGKSQTTRHVCDELQAMGKKVVAVRHPMPCGDL